MASATQVLRQPGSLGLFGASRNGTQATKRERVAYGLQYADWRLSADPDLGLLATWRIRSSIKSFLRLRLTGHEDDAAVRALVKEALDRELDLAEKASAGPDRLP